jgi:hypothetical protein
VLTSTHLLIQSHHNSDRVLEAFPLPNNIPESSTGETLQLSRSHILYHPYYLREMIFLPSLTKHTHSRVKKDRHGRRLPLTTTSMTFLVLVDISESVYYYYVSFFDVVLESPAVGEGSMTVYCPPGRQVSCGDIRDLKVQNDYVRILTKHPCLVGTVYLAEGNRTIKGTILPFEDCQPKVLGGDCLRGKVCGRDLDGGRIRIYDYLWVL